MLGVLGIAVDLTPFLKINPIRWMLGKFGRLINRELYEKVDSLTARVNQAEINSKKYRMTSLHNQLFQMHQYYTEKGYVTETELDNFTAALEEYYANNGNGTVHQKLAPEVFALPLRHDPK